MVRDGTGTLSRKRPFTAAVQRPLRCHTRFSENTDILADLGHLQERQSKVGPETALECARCATWEIPVLYADDACIVSRSPRGLERIMPVFTEVFSSFDLNISEGKTETTCMPVSCALARQIVFNSSGQQYSQATSFTYLGGGVTEAPNLSAEIDMRIYAGWISSGRYTRELFDRPMASLLRLKARMLKSGVVKAFLYGCMTWTPLASISTSFALHITGCCSKS